MRQLYCALVLTCAVCSNAAAANQAYLTDAIKNPAYLRSLTSLLKNAGKLPSWTRQVLKTSGNYVGTPVAYSTVDGIRYELFYACKPHDCDNNGMELMFAPHGAKVWAAMVQDGKAVTYLGTPNAAQQAALKEAFQK
ncbi:MAG: Ivy family c-type lysozyme inhibitor [Xanthobacteraceae bacterium]